MKYKRQPKYKTQEMPIQIAPYSNIDAQADNSIAGNGFNETKNRNWGLMIINLSVGVDPLIPSTVQHTI